MRVDWLAVYGILLWAIPAHIDTVKDTKVRYFLGSHSFTEGRDAGIMQHLTNMRGITPKNKLVALELIKSNTRNWSTV